MYDVDSAVIGGGVVGLACAVALARAGREVILLERHAGMGQETTSRNSEVIHGGMYYPTGSLKQRFCVEGRRRLYDYLADRSVDHRRCGKLIVATNLDEMTVVEAILERGKDNGVEGLALLSGAQATAMEGALSCVGALWSPETGIVDCHGLMVALRGELESLGGAIAFSTPVIAVDRAGQGGFVVRTGGDDPFALAARDCINSAGLQAQAVARRIEGLDAVYIPALVLAKGSYFSCATRPAFSRLIYPAPVKGGLGVHVTLNLAGRMRPREGQRLLRRRATLLAGVAGRNAPTGLCWLQTQACCDGARRSGFSHRRRGGSRGGGSGQSVRNREPGPDKRLGDRG